MWDLTPENIERGRNHVACRPGMYFGGKDHRALVQAVIEVAENALEFAVRGNPTEVIITLGNDGWITAQDNGPGLRVDIFPGTELSFAEIVMTVVGGRHFDEGRQKFHGGSFGVGLAAVNAVCEQAALEVRRDGYLWSQQYVKGTAVTRLVNVRPLHEDEQTGTTIRFKPGAYIFEPDAYEQAEPLSKISDWVYLLPNLWLRFEDFRVDKNEVVTLHHPNGIVDWVRDLCGDEMLHEPLYVQTTFQTENRGEIWIEAAVTFADNRDSTLLSFANHVATPGGGIHVDAFISALRRTLRQITAKSQAGKITNLPIGLCAVVNCRLRDPQFSSQNALGLDLRLSNPITDVLDEPLAGSLRLFFEQHPEIAHIIAERWVKSPR